MVNEKIVLSLKLMREFNRRACVGKNLCLLDQLSWVAAVASNRENEVIQAQGDRRLSSALESLRKLNAMKVICKRRDESDDDRSHLGPELKKENMYDFDSKKEKSKLSENKSKDHPDRGDSGKKRNMVTFISKKDEDAAATESLTENDDDDDGDDVCAFEFKKRDDKGKSLETKYYLQPSTRSHRQDSPEEFTRKHLEFQKKMFINSKNVDHSDLGMKRKMVSFNCKEENSSRSATRPRRKYGIQIREPSSRTYEDIDAEDEGWDVESKKSKGLMMYNKNKRQRFNPPPSTAHQHLPENFKKKIETMGGDGDKARLVCQKRLYNSDIAQQQNRLSLPVNQLLCNFLEPDEVERLEDINQSMNITIIDPMCTEEAMCFKKWCYKETVKSYVLITRWSTVAKKNALEAGDLIQVWSFRDRENNLHLAVVKRDENSDGAAGYSSSSSVNATANTSVGGGEGTSGGDHAGEDSITAGVVTEESKQSEF